MQKKIQDAGLLSADKKKVQSKFPLLWRIPWIGPKFFTHNSVVENKTDLIIQITPKIVNDSYTGIDISNAIQAVEKDLTDELESEILKRLVNQVKKTSSKEEILKLQEALGMDKEDSDGMWGPKTDEYLEQYLNNQESDEQE